MCREVSRVQLMGTGIILITLNTYRTTGYCQCCTSIGLAASPSLPGWSSGRAVKQPAQGGEGLANIALDHISLECQLHVSEVPARV